MTSTLLRMKAVPKMSVLHSYVTREMSIRNVNRNVTIEFQIVRYGAKCTNQYRD